MRKFDPAVALAAIATFARTENLVVGPDWVYEGNTTRVTGTCRLHGEGAHRYWTSSSTNWTQTDE